MVILSCNNSNLDLKIMILSNKKNLKNTFFVDQ
jgi:hypothetical protein